MKILITGAAGFIGYHLCEKLIKTGHNVVGLDNINNYYNPQLKIDRLIDLGFDLNDLQVFHTKVKSKKHQNLSFQKTSLEDIKELNILFEQEKFDIVCNLAAQAGVRYSIENPSAFIQSNLVGFSNVLECSRKHKISHLIYASSSSVYGLNKEIPFKTSDRVDSPISLYAATKRSNELMAHVYSHLYKMPTTGLRFFTVYGPWGRPDMAMFLFVEKILKGQEILVYNEGEMERDFTFIDDIVIGIKKVIENKNSHRILQKDLFKIYNIGNNTSVRLLDFIKAIEEELGIKAIKQMSPIQPGDVKKTWADSDELAKDYNYRPRTDIREGMKSFISWYKNYYKLS